MSSGPKRVQSRTNIRTQVRNRHGGARSGSGRKKKTNAREDMRALLIERMQITIERPKELGKHWVDHWIIQLRDPQISATIPGIKLAHEMFKLIFFKSPNSIPRRFARDDEEPGDSNSSEDLGQKGLPPRKPDPAKCAIQLPPLMPDLAVQKAVPLKPDNE